MNNNFKTSASALLAAASLLSTGAVVSADLEEILVTGLKRESTVMETPSAITALSASDLAAKGLSDIRQIQYAVPSLHFGESYNNRNISIRGIGGFLEQPGVITSINGVTQANDASSQLGQLDLDRVEVLRGPQGTLYGRNAVGGAVNFIAASPTDEMYGKVMVGLADFDQTSAEIVLSGPISDSVGVRLAASHLDAGDGWVENLMPGNDDLMKGEKTNVRLIVTAELSDNLDAELMLGRSEQSGRWTHWAMIKEDIAFGVQTFLPAVSVRDNPDGDPILFTEEPQKVYMRGPTNTDRELDIYSLTLNWDLEDFSVKSITSKQDWSNAEQTPADSTSSGILMRSSEGTNKTLSQELTLSGQTDKLNWIVGGFYMDDERTDMLDIQFQENIAFGFAPFFNNSRPLYENEVTAVFADATYSMSEDIRLGLGVRDTTEKKVHSTFAAGFMPFCGGAEPFIQKWEDSQTTMRASAEYDMSENGMIYVSYSEGFKAGGANNGDCNAPYSPETLEASEIGFKSTFSGGSTTLRVAAFQYDYSDFQILQVKDFAANYLNADDAEITGMELELTSVLNDSWMVNAGLTLLETEYGEFLQEDLSVFNGVKVQIAGNPLNNAPQASLILGVTYDTILSSGSKLSLSVDGAYRSRVYFREFGNVDDSQEGYTIVNFNANWVSADEDYAARFFVSNLTDKAHVTGMYALQTTYGRQGTWNMPRQAGFEITKFFGAR
ncbi:TonB-dependent receptor [Porticoccaceae bacterium]|nr:TonB-dependent receptor [Porticoccaceae bacterium]